MQLPRRRSIAYLAGLAGLAALGAPGALAQSAAGPDALIRQVSTEVIEAIKADKAIQAGEINRILALVDGKVMPHVNFNRMAASAIGRPWREATPEQRRRLQEEFKTMLVRTYSGAMSQVKDQSVVIKPSRGGYEGSDVVVRTEVRGRGEPIQLDYRLEKTPEGWKVYDVNIAGVWMVEQYRNMFAPEIQAGGLDGLIARLAERNRGAGKS